MEHIGMAMAMIYDKRFARKARQWDEPRLRHAYCKAIEKWEAFIKKNRPWFITKHVARRAADIQAIAREKGWTLVWWD